MNPFTALLDPGLTRGAVNDERIASLLGEALTSMIHARAHRADEVRQVA
jgi:hypothetical protein